MARGIRHPPRTRVANRSTLQRNASNATSNSEEASQRNTTDAPSQVESESATQRGRKVGSQTKLAVPLRGSKVLLEPTGDMQFSYVNFEPPYKYTTQLGVIIKREYPSLIEEKDDDGAILSKRAALDWPDYFVTENDQGETSGDRVLAEFWRLFDVRVEDRNEADRVLDNYLKKRVRDIIHQARVDSVKLYLKLGDKLARPIELEYDQYVAARVTWCPENTWPYLCRYWCSDSFKLKRKRGQESRFSSEDIAQNHGGSRPFAETQQVLEAKYGPAKATKINTYAVMKSGMKSVDSSGKSGTIKSHKAQKRIDDYIRGVKRATRGDEEDEELEDLDEEQDPDPSLNGQVLYDLSGGTPHGRLAIANGAVRAADVRAAAKAKHVRPSNSVSFQSIARENAQLRCENARLRQENRENALRHDQAQVTTDLLLGLFRDLGKEVPADALQRLSATLANVTGASQVGSGSNDNDVAGCNHGGMNLDDENIDNNNGSNSCPSRNHASQ